MPKQTRTKKVSAAQVRAYAGKAQEYADAAASETEAERFIAATSLAVHAGINASDAVNEPDDVAVGVATKAVERAQKCVAIAQTVASTTR